MLTITIRSIFEFLPLLLAVFAIIQCARAFKYNKVIFSLSLAALIMFVINQSSWISSLFVENIKTDTDFALILWTVFHLTVVVILGLVGTQVIKNNKE